jgi:hypothetical protein
MGGNSTRFKATQPASLSAARRIRRLIIRTAAGLLLAMAYHAVPAQSVGPPAGSSAKIASIVRLDETPVIDGVLDEEVWTRAARIDDLHQVNPIEYDEASEPTEVFLFYTSDALYVAARLWDSQADRITAQVLRQGEGLANEDRFAVILDPNLDRRSGYRFQVNPNGVRWEALYQDTSSLQSDWTGIWQTAATRDAEGWTAEMRIPFKSISFDRSVDSWGINFERTIQRNDETIGWVSRNRQMNPSIAGRAAGFFGLEQGVGLDVVPSVSVIDQRVHGPLGREESNLQPSLDVFYKITPSLNATLTVNTDFSATDVDDRQVNLTRFSLFFPEQRDFFLQDADIFEFGRLGSENGRPFFSRRIGLSAGGEPIDLEYGGKISGRLGRWNIGALGVRQGDFQGVPAQNVFVGRVTANVLAESSAGIIVTEGDPRSNLGSTLVGADFLYRNTRLPGGRVLQGEAWYLETSAEHIEGDNRAFGFGVAAPNNIGWQGGARLKQIEQNFAPAVGFVNQPGVRSYSADVGYRWRFASYIRTVFTGMEASRTEHLDNGRADAESLRLEVNFSTDGQDRMFLNFDHNRQVPLGDFRIYSASDGSKEVVIARGDYSYDSMFLGIRTGEQRKVAAFLGIGTGEYFDGDRSTARTNISWRPSPHVRLQAGYDVQDISLSGGDFIVRIASMRAQFAFSSTLSWSNLVQYDNVSEAVSFNSRLHWIPQAGREGFVVFNHGLEDRDKNDSFRSTNADVAIKFSYTWRF